MCTPCLRCALWFLTPFHLYTMSAACALLRKAMGSATWESLCLCLSTAATSTCSCLCVSDLQNPQNSKCGLFQKSHQSLRMSVECALPWKKGERLYGKAFVCAEMSWNTVYVFVSEVLKIWNLLIFQKMNLVNDIGGALFAPNSIWNGWMACLVCAKRRWWYRYGVWVWVFGFDNQWSLGVCLSLKQEERQAMSGESSVLKFTLDGWMECLLSIQS